MSWLTRAFDFIIVLIYPERPSPMLTLIGKHRHYRISIEKGKLSVNCFWKVRKRTPLSQQKWPLERDVYLRELSVSGGSSVLNAEWVWYLFLLFASQVQVPDSCPPHSATFCFYSDSTPAQTCTLPQGPQGSCSVYYM